MDRPRLGIEPLLFALLGFTWGSSYVAIKVVGEELEPFVLVAARLVIGAAVLALALRLQGDALPPRSAWKHLAVVSVTGMILPFTLITWGQRGVDAGLASIFNAATPLFTVVLAALVLADEPARLGRVVGIAVGFVGVVVVLGGGVEGGGSPIALAALLLAVASYAVTAVWTRRFLAGERPLPVATGQVLIGAVVAPAVTLVVHGVPADPPSGTALIAVAWLGVISSGLGPLLFFRLLATWGATRTALVNYLIPLVGIAGGALVFGEQPGQMTLVGAAIVLAGVTVANATGAPATVQAVVRAPVRAVAAVVRVL